MISIEVYGTCIETFRVQEECIEYGSDGTRHHFQRQKYNRIEAFFSASQVFLLG
jgi:hypothetical protein